MELQKRIDAAGLDGAAVSLHPGVVQTDLARYIIGGVEAGDVRLSETAEKPKGTCVCSHALLLACFAQRTPRTPLSL